MKFTIKYYLIVIIMLIITSGVFAQTGSVKGTIKDVSKTGLPGASVILEGTTQGAMTDMDGNFEILNIKLGSVNLKVSYIGYISEIIENVIIASGSAKNINVTLKENIKQLQTADVVAQRSTHTENAVLMEVKQSDQIVSGISNQQISKSQDRTASEVLKRIPGVTKRENGFIIIRGLDERYNVSFLNGVIAPSMEADKRAFDMDLIPSSMLDRLLIYKTGAPELPGDFTGGLIKVVTKNVSEDDQFQVGYTTNVRVNTTFKDFYQAPKGSTDWLGTDDGTRTLPGSFPASLYDVQSTAELTALGRELPNAWTAAKIKASPDQKFSASLIKNVKFGKVKASNITSVKYDITYETATAENNGFNAYDIEQQKSDTIYSYNDEMYKENVRLSFIHNWSFLLSPKSKIEFRNFFNQQGSNQTILRDGSNYEEGNLVKSYAYRYQERTIYSGQLHGSHDLFANRSKLEWTTGYSFAHSAEPDFRRIRTKKDLTATNDSIPYQIIIAPSASIQDAGRYYSDLNEHTETVTADFEHSLKPYSDLLIPKIRAGFYAEAKQREFSARWMSYKQSKLALFDESLVYLPLDQIFSQENINDSTGFKLEEGTNPSDKYDATNTLLAGYIGTTWPFSSKITVSGGVRVEHNVQKLESRTYANKKIEVDNTVTDILPSINASYNLTKKMLIRAAYFSSVNRPEFREVAPFSYYDFTFNNVLYGNPELQNANIMNYDIRWELYPSISEMISFGVFYKDFTNPIEMFFVPGSGSGGTRNFTYENAESAQSFGLEVEVRKSFISMFDTTGRDQGAFVRKFLSRSGVTFNAAYITSDVSLGDKAVGQSESRPMMGQSPFVVNGGLFFANVEKQFQVSAQYNIIGKRLFAVGTYGTPDIYYMPRNQLDFTVSKGLGKHVEVKFGVQDVLAQDEVYKQDSNENGDIDNADETVFKVKRGAYYSLGINLKF